MLGAVRDLWRTRRELRFLVVGAWNTAFGYLIFVGIYWLLAARLHYLAIATTAHFIAVTQSFASQRRLVFEASGPWLPQYLRFNAANLAALAGSLGLLFVLVERIGLHVLVSQALTTAVAVAASYLLHKHYSFRKT